MVKEIYCLDSVTYKLKLTEEFLATPVPFFLEELSDAFFRLSMILAQLCYNTIFGCRGLNG